MAKSILASLSQLTLLLMNVYELTYYAVGYIILNSAATTEHTLNNYCVPTRFSSYYFKLNKDYPFNGLCNA